MQDQCNERVREQQQQFFGKRFVGATLARTRLDTESSEKIAKWMTKPKGFLVIAGPSGTGKTYLCSALLESVPSSVRFVRAYSERTLFRQIRNNISDGNGDYLAFLHQKIDDDLIILDDIGSSGHTDWREEVLMETVDFRYESMLPTIFTSNLYKKEFKETYGQRITSRLFARENTIINLEGQDDLREEGL